MDNALKNEITEFIKQALSLPENAVITRGSVQITEKDEVEIIGATSVDYQHFDLNHPEEVNAEPSPEPRTKRGRKAKKEKEPKTPSLRRAREGEGSDITDAQIKWWRIVLGVRQRSGGLTKEQAAALEATKGVHAGSLAPEQRQQIKDIFDETTPKQF